MVLISDFRHMQNPFLLAPKLFCWLMVSLLRHFMMVFLLICHPLVCQGNFIQQIKKSSVVKSLQTESTLHKTKWTYNCCLSTMLLYNLNPISFVSLRSIRAYTGGSLWQPAEAAPQPHSVHRVPAAGSGKSFPTDAVSWCQHEREAGCLHQPAWGSHSGQSSLHHTPDCLHVCIAVHFWPGKYFNILLHLPFYIKLHVTLSEWY